MTPATKLALRRFALRWLRELVDVADDRLHAAEVNLRKEISDGTLDRGAAVVGVSDLPDSLLLAKPARQRQEETFLEWEARRSGLTPKVKTHRRRVRSSAADFDFQIIRKREEFVQ
jgi:hypothetical protein